MEQLDKYSKDENIISIAVRVGLDKEITEKYLLTDESKLKVLQAEQEAQKLGISGVPFYIIDNKYGISGAQLSETFIKTFEETEIATLVSKEACDIENGEC